MEAIRFPGIRSFYAVVAIAAFLSVCSVSGQSDNLLQAKYKRIDVPSSVLQSVTTKEKFPTFSRVACAQRAITRQNQWYHLACFSDSGICSLYNISLPSNYQAPDGNLDDLVECHTDLPDGCESNNQYYLEGETLMENCVNVTCTDKAWNPTDPDHKICPNGYESAPGAGCVQFVQSGMAFDLAKAHCENMGDRLAIPEDFHALRMYMLCQKTAPIYRVGIFNGQWMDGQPVNPDFYHSSSPQPTTCSYMWDVSYNRMLYEKDCATEFFFICQKP